MYHISFGQEEFGEIRTVLPGDAGYQSDVITHFKVQLRGVSMSITGYILTVIPFLRKLAIGLVGKT